MQKITCHFDKAQYLPGEPVRLILPAHSALLSATFFRMERPVTLRAVREGDVLVLTDVPVGGYGVRISTEDGVWEGAFDVVSDRRTEIRYGFLSDFSSGDGDRLDVEWMRDLHLNAVQFYDWMYRHDRLLPPTEQYDDPMGRQTDLSVISKKIEHCKACGIRPLAYGAVYAATKDTFAAHPTWGMYTMGGQPMTFAGWLYYMNVAASCGWAKHIVEEFRSAVRFGFSGIHMDTYGFPKRIWDAEHRPVELADEFPHLIDAAAQAVREEAADGGVIFNAVNNWPTETVAAAAQDAVYIEVWPPHDTYFGPLPPDSGSAAAVPPERHPCRLSEGVSGGGYGRGRALIPSCVGGDLCLQRYAARSGREPQPAAGQLLCQLCPPAGKLSSNRAAELRFSCQIQGFVI